MSTSVEDVENIFEMTREELQDYNQKKYLEFKEIYCNTDTPVDEIFQQLEVNKGDPTYRYINGTRRSENLKRPVKEHTKNCRNTKTTLKIGKTPEEAYEEYKYLFYNTELSIAEIYEEIGVPQNQNTHYVYIRKHAELDGLNGYSRRMKLKHGGRPKGSKDLKKLSGEEKEIKYKYFEGRYQEFLEYYKDLDLSVADILKKMGTHHKSNMYFYFRERMEEDGLDPTKRQGEVLSRKIKKTYDERRKNCEPLYEETYQEYKKLFNESKLSLKEIYDALGVDPRSVCAQHIKKRAKEDGLSAHKRRWELFPPDTHKVTEEEQKIRDELYNEFERLFIETDTNVMDIYKKLGVKYNDVRGRYIREKAHENGLNGNTRHIEVKVSEELEEIFQEYKRLFNNTKYRISEIYEEINVKQGSREFRYIRKRAKEEGLDGKKRMYNQMRKKTTGRRFKKRGKNRQTGKTKYSAKTVKQVEDSMDTLSQVFIERNVQESTSKGYIASMYHWFHHFQDKYPNLQANIDVYITEEDERVPMRDRTIKHDLLKFREYLINCETMHTSKSIMSYYSKITAIFRHFGLEIPTLPKAKLEKGYVSNYNDLPTHEMIRTACEQSSDVLKATILFMSSSGSAKAETLSITIGMFLEGCSEYLDEYPTPENMDEIIRVKLRDRHDIVPLIYLRRIKTDKWYHTCCSPEASYCIIEYLNTLPELKWDDQLFPFSSSLLLTRFQEINDQNNWGRVGGYRRFRAHALRKFMASNIGLPRDQVDSFQGRSKDMIQEAYFKQDPRQLKEIYLGAMHNVMIFNNWEYPIGNETSIKPKPVITEEPVRESKPIIETPIAESPEPVAEQPKKDNQKSIAEELLMYSELMEKGLLTKDEFNQIKEKLLGGILS
ncbi:hypothetical protein [Methanobrevibacter sp.]|uniref:hypothetical protein n=1 Tax=Methanobrevibacter sp. TaxID=66852 RepID=UPI00386CB1F6